MGPHVRPELGRLRVEDLLREAGERRGRRGPRRSTRRAGAAPRSEER